MRRMADSMSVAVFYYEHLDPRPKHQPNLMMWVFMSFTTRYWNLPCFRLRRNEGNKGVLEQAWQYHEPETYRTIELSVSPTFAAQYVLQGENEQELCVFFSQQVIEFLEWHHHLEMESDGNALIIAFPLRKQRAFDSPSKFSSIISSYLQEGFEVFNLFLGKTHFSALEEQETTLLQEVDIAFEEELIKPTDSRSIETLIQALNDPDRDVCIQAIIALADRQDSQAVAPLLKLLRKQDTRIRQAVILALGAIGDPCAIPALIGMLKLPHTIFREVSTEALAAIGSAHAHINALIAALEYGTPELRKQVGQSLIEIGSDVEEPVARFLTHQQAALREQAAEILRRIGSQRAHTP